MFSDRFTSFVERGLSLTASIFVLSIGLAVLGIIGLYIYDKTQRQHAILRNFPVLGHLRYVFEDMGIFFRQYFFAADREELPFNRAQRGWVYQAAKDLDNTVAFGSTRLLTPIGTVMFVNCLFPTMRVDALDPGPLTFGPYCEHPYTTSSLFNISAMSFGAISKPAVLALSNGAKKAGCWLNTGEGGLSPYHLDGGCDLVFQIGTAKYGVRNAEGGFDRDKLKALAAHDEIKMFEIKLSQGAKPGKGGILPGEKVTEEIAAIRGIPAGEDSISPNRHPEINSISDLLDAIELVRSITGKPTGFKVVIGAYGWVDELCVEILRRGPESAPDFITIDSADGGTGAAPAPLMDYVGLPISESLPIVVDVLNRHALKGRIRIITSGKLVTPAEVAWAICMGADYITSARGFMFALGCIQALQCNKNTCPTGVTTHDEKLQQGLDPTNKAERVANYVKNMNYEVGMIAHSCGVKEPRELSRMHARIVGEDGRTHALEDLYPEEKPLSDYAP
ncbi:MAG: FMN-binding glutamate synthase family protein [Alphaproteobacteria bacterium]|nr:MAG: FMN-binding glutamate synthase family protein [Alphaproteobacteria bacterium]